MNIWRVGAKRFRRDPKIRDNKIRLDKYETKTLHISDLTCLISLLPRKRIGDRMGIERWKKRRQTIYAYRDNRRNRIKTLTIIKRFRRNNNNNYYESPLSEAVSDASREHPQTLSSEVPRLARLQSVKDVRCVVCTRLVI